MASEEIIDRDANKRCCLVLLCGLPGAGKTTFAKTFLGHLKLQDKNSRVVHVCYDDLISRARQAEMAREAASRNDDNEQESAWKSARASIVASVRRHLSTWLAKQAQEIETNSVNADLDDLSELFDKECKIKDGDDAKKDLIVIVDDNNYLRSMRHEYFKIARSLNAGFCQLYFPCSEPELATANESRPDQDKVPVEVVQAMSAKMEEPDPGRNTWERFSFKVATFDGDQQRVQSLPLEMCASVVQLALSNPEVEPPDDSEEKEKDRQICMTSQVHQVDRSLRQLVSSHMRSSTSADKKSEAKLLNEARAQLLEQIKSGRLKLPKDSGELERMFQDMVSKTRAKQ